MLFLCVSDTYVDFRTLALRIVDYKSATTGKYLLISQETTYLYQPINLFFNTANRKTVCTTGRLA